MDQLQNFLKKYSFVILILIIAIITSTHFWSHKSFYNDGARFFVDLLRYKWYSYDSNLRFGSITWHVLANLLSRPFVGLVEVNMLNFWFRFLFCFHPLFSLLISYQILKKQKRLGLISYQILYFLIIGLLCSTNQASFLYEAPSYFWPLFFLSLQRNLSKKQWTLFAFLYYQLVTCYLTCLLPVIGIYFQTLFLHGKKRRDRNRILALLTLGTFIFTIYRYFRFADPATQSRILTEFRALFTPNGLKVLIPS